MEPPRRVAPYARSDTPLGLYRYESFEIGVNLNASSRLPHELSESSHLLRSQEMRPLNTESFWDDHDPGQIAVEIAVSEIGYFVDTVDYRNAPRT